MAINQSPAIAALFLVVFDQKLGYKLAWYRSFPGVDLKDIEFKCMPSGLHDTRSDVVYFRQYAYAGIAAFANVEADVNFRGSRCAAVGVLVDASDGRLGGAWLHAARLRELASESAETYYKHSADEMHWMETYWDRWNLSSDIVTSPLALSESKAALGVDTRDVTSLTTAPRDHPALSIMASLDYFGPLIFPLYRAALLRKRILLVGGRRVQQVCDWIYNISVFTEVDRRSGLLQCPERRLRSATLHSVGVNDIDYLQSTTLPWIACTTDSIITEKKGLYDLVIEISPTDGDGQSRWPKIHTGDHQHYLATQRDARRYTSLYRELQRHCRRPLARADPHQHSDRSRQLMGKDARNHDENSSPSFTDATTAEEESSALLEPVLKAENGIYTYTSGAASIIEPASWSSVAYRSLMWWASASEQEDWEAEETLADQALLERLPMLEGIQQTNHGGARTGELRNTAVLTTSYFCKLTTNMVKAMSRFVENSGSDVVELSADDLRHIGLDDWSTSDRDFVRQFVKLYFDKDVVIEEDALSICGLRIC